MLRSYFPGQWFGGEAKAEAQRTARALRPFINAGIPIVGLEPSCLFTMRDEFQSLLDADLREGFEHNALMFEEFLVREHRVTRLSLKLSEVGASSALSTVIAIRRLSMRSVRLWKS